MDQPTIKHVQPEVPDKQQVDMVEKIVIGQVDSDSLSTAVSENVNEPVVIAIADNFNVLEIVDETSATSSATSTPPRAQFQRNSHTKPDTTSPRRMNVNPNYPVLVYQYPLSQQQQQKHSEEVRSKGNIRLI